MRNLRVTLRPSPLVNFALTARVLRRSPRNLVDRVDDDGIWTRAAVLSGGPALLQGRQHGATLIFDAAPALAGDRRAIEAFVTRLFSLDLDPAPFWRRVRREPGLVELARRCAGLRPQRFPTLFEALANGICCQQLSLAAGMTRLGHLSERFGVRTSDDTRVGPPEPRRVAKARLSTLQQAGLSARRAAQLRDLARLPLERFEHELTALPDAEARARLLGRILGRVIEPPDAVRFAARFAPLRGMLYFCMLGYMLGVS
jgi:DNA-3-methyladenine glycosylase II